MDGQYLNEVEINNKFEKWKSRVFLTNTSWQANNIHIDELIDDYSDKRRYWIKDSLYLFKILTDRNVSNQDLIPFLHIELSDSKKRQDVKNVSEEWMTKNVHEFTPPSFNYTSKEYFSNFYLNEFSECILDLNRNDVLTNFTGFVFYYRSYFDESERKYSREIYVFKD